MLGRSINWPFSSLAVVVASRGAKRGASERRYRATAGNVQRLKLLVGPHLAIRRSAAYCELGKMASDLLQRRQAHGPWILASGPEVPQLSPVLRVPGHRE